MAAIVASDKRAASQRARQAVQFAIDVLQEGLYQDDAELLRSIEALLDIREAAGGDLHRAYQRLVDEMAS